MTASSKRSICRLAPLAVALVVGVAAFGCGAGNKGSVSGEVKYNGQPLPSGTITFLSQSGQKHVAGGDIVNGKYTVSGVDAGPAKVTVVTLAPSRGGQPPTGKAIEPTGVAPEPGGKYVPIPPRYASPEQSGLSYEVKSGAQTKDFELTR